MNRYAALASDAAQKRRVYAACRAEGVCVDCEQVEVYGHVRCAWCRHLRAVRQRAYRERAMTSMWSADSDLDYRDELDRYNEPSQRTQIDTCDWPACEEPVSGSIAGVGGSGAFCRAHLREKSRQFIAAMAARHRGEVA